MNLKPKIVITESQGFSPLALALLADVAEVVEADADERTLPALAANADVLWVRLRHRIGAAVMDAAPRLRIIASPTTGLNHIDVEEAARRGIEVMSLRGERAFLEGIRATAEHTIALMLSLLRRIPAAISHVRRGGWDRESLRGSELYGKTIGIVGYGRLGRIVARYAQTFDACVLASDPYVQTADHGVRLVALPELLDAADIVTLHVNLAPENHRFFGRAQFRAMRSGSWFINTSRGELVDERALIGALRAGRLNGAAVDVITDEFSRAHSPLLAYARRHGDLIVTPHIGGCTVESMEKTELFLAKKVREALSGHDVHVVPGCEAATFSGAKD